MIRWLKQVFCVHEYGPFVSSYPHMAIVRECERCGHRLEYPMDMETHTFKFPEIEVKLEEEKDDEQKQV